MSKLLPHHVEIEPIRKEQSSGGIQIPQGSRQVHTQLGWIVAVSDVLEEAIHVDDMVVFAALFTPRVRHDLAYQGKETRIRTHDHKPAKDTFSLHEDDIELVVEDW